MKGDKKLGIKLTGTMLNFLPLIVAVAVQPFIEIENPVGIWLILTFLYGAVLRSFYEAVKKRKYDSKIKKKRKHKK